jgi:hypothetical protein
VVNSCKNRFFCAVVVFEDLDREEF